ncbi:MAG: hypothetical protein GY734_21550 [Herbaspirillum sp.]|uniref:hypothetical protein n=1 Tax=Herbaspirillum sp. TaxID=1890675 RepID=UPI0025910E32|nr:hypothetical protein [Herbaspirillum sp.]MCP3658451.1 hypothetical protein [Herbaspirillum sp.]MCP3950113.1 hypothetical protein [Herbaspirillum sp.]MCP4033804.1 hypothetical protein [Herbaspirillum sp.]MCP4555100.1 hypothetical protein [Herbaspirillum sp.]
MQDTFKSDLLWHIKNALSKKFILLPFIAPCYATLYGLGYLGLYISYFLRTVMLKTTEERNKYFSEVSIEMKETNDKAIFAFYALAMTFFYWYLFDYNHEATTLLQFLNFPTYAAGASLVKAFMLLS